MRIKVLALAVIALIAVTAAACSSGEASTPAPVAEGTLSGTVSIGPLCPVEPCNSTTNPYPGHDIVLTNSNGVVVSRIAVRQDGSFSGKVPVGDYVVTLDPCEYLGCNFGSSTSVTVRETEVADVKLDIDTGIR